MLEGASVCRQAGRPEERCGGVQQLGVVQSVLSQSHPCPCPPRSRCEKGRHREGGVCSIGVCKGQGGSVRVAGVQCVRAKCVVGQRQARGAKAVCVRWCAKGSKVRA